ncbi:hypothetical protein C8R44DRAFT_864395 [Mycena epipterygia]|nr:hypothetical protein C8R44DRAFT_864395 [Mycena epipterygia]
MAMPITYCVKVRNPWLDPSCRPLALEFGRHGITVNPYAPGEIDPDMLAQGATDGIPYDTVKETSRTVVIEDIV